MGAERKEQLHWEVFTCNSAFLSLLRANQLNRSHLTVALLRTRTGQVPYTSCRSVGLNPGLTVLFLGFLNYFKRGVIYLNFLGVFFYLEF